jgi:hypothetical protein
MGCDADDLSIPRMFGWFDHELCPETVITPCFAWLSDSFLDGDLVLPDSDNLLSVTLLNADINADGEN